MVSIFSRRRRLCLLGLALALAPWLPGCGGPPDSAAAPAVDDRSTSPDRVPDTASTESFGIVFLGDSLSAGYGLAEDQAFPALVQAELRSRGHDVEVINAGVSGDTTAGGLSRLDWVLSTGPGLLVVELGGNDALRGQPLENIEKNLRQIVRGGKAAGARVLLLGMDVPTNFGADYGGAFAELYPRIAKEEQVELLPGFVRTVGTDPRLMMGDGLHPTAAGHRTLARSLVVAIEELLP